MMLYSLKGLKPEPLPFRLKFPDGFTRTDPSTFTADEISAAGYTGPYEYPTYDSKTETVDWTGTEFIVRPYNTQELEEQWSKVREQRNQLLKNCDWTQLKDYNFNLENQTEWEIYRETLRNLPKEQDNPFDILWPEVPLINN